MRDLAFPRKLQLEPPGGYFVRLDSFEGLDLVWLARQALVSEGLSVDGVALRVGVHRKRKVVHVTYDGPFLHGAGAGRWFVEHHALATLLSCRVPSTVQTWALDPAAFEEVCTWGNGRRVGGERLDYAKVELPEEAESDDVAFERLQRHWPLGHLAYVFGLTRVELLQLARTPTLRLSLSDGPGVEQLAELLPSASPYRARGQPGPKP